MAGKKLTYKVKPDIEKNRLELYLKGQITKKDLNSFYTDLRFAVADLTDGFDVMTDLRECEFSSLDSVETVNKITSFLIEKRVKSVVRIVNDKQLIYRQIFNYELRQTGIKIIYVKNREEAEKELENALQRDGLRFKMIDHGIDYTIGIRNKTGTILDISTTGCAIKAATISPDPTDKTCLTIKFNNHDELIDTFTCSAETMWVDGNVFAVRFEGLDKSLVKNLHKRLAHECRKIDSEQQCP